MTLHDPYQDKSFLETLPGAAHLLVDPASRAQKAAKMLAVIRDFATRRRPQAAPPPPPSFRTQDSGLRTHSVDLGRLRCLDLGCSAGHIASHLAAAGFGEVVGVDSDARAIALAREWHSLPNLRFEQFSIAELPDRPDFAPGSFDVIVCNHVYEHVADQRRLAQTIWQLLGPNGFCYFSAGNRLVLVEGHYKLPFLSWPPHPVSHLYLRLTGRGHYYEEVHLTYWGLRQLLCAFTIHDYTLKIIKEPQRFASEDLVGPGSFVTGLPTWSLKAVYPLIPTYIWILTRKRSTGSGPPAPRPPSDGTAEPISGARTAAP